MPCACVIYAFTARFCIIAARSRHTLDTPSPPNRHVSSGNRHVTPKIRTEIPRNLPTSSDSFRVLHVFLIFSGSHSEAGLDAFRERTMLATGFFLEDLDLGDVGGVFRALKHGKLPVRRKYKSQSTVLAH